MINKPPPFTGLKIRIPIIIPIKGRGFINHGFRLMAGLLILGVCASNVLSAEFQIGNAEGAGGATYSNTVQKHRSEPYSRHQQALYIQSVNHNAI